MSFPSLLNFLTMKLNLLSVRGYPQTFDALRCVAAADRDAELTIASTRERRKPVAVIILGHVLSYER